MSQPEIDVINTSGDEHLACGCSSEFEQGAQNGQSNGPFDWCKFRRAVMLNWDIRAFYMPFLSIDVPTLKACPLGAITMLLFDSYLKLVWPHVVNITMLPSFRRAEAAWMAMLGVGRVTMSGVIASGWMPFFQLSSIRYSMERRGISAGLTPASSKLYGSCVQVPTPGSARAAILRRLEESSFGMRIIGVEEAFRMLSDESGTAVGTCNLARAAIALGVVFALQQRTRIPGETGLGTPYRAVGDQGGGTGLVSGGSGLQQSLELAQLMKYVDEQIHNQFQSGSLAHQPFSLWLATPWPLMEQADLLCHSGTMALAMATPLSHMVSYYETVHASSQSKRLTSLVDALAVSAKSVIFMRVFPFRELISDMVRYSALPFCGLRPFMRMVASIAESAVAANCKSGAPLSESGSLPCELTFVEGGPHMGDCSLWAAGLLSQVGVQLRAVAFEPLPDAAALFRQSVVENDLAGSLSVRTAALGQDPGSAVDLLYFKGHNGQATVDSIHMRAYLASENAKESDVARVKGVPVVALDQEIPASWPVVDIVKLSVNGAERDTLAGARRLLSERRLCSVLMHTMKAGRGREVHEVPGPPSPPAPPGSSSYSEDLLHLLEEGGMEVYTHRDFEGGTTEVRRVVSASDLDKAFDDPTLTLTDYIMARSMAPHCDLAKRHFHAAAGLGGDQDLPIGSGG